MQFLVVFGLFAFANVIGVYGDYAETFAQRLAFFHNNRSALHQLVNKHCPHHQGTVEDALQEVQDCVKSVDRHDETLCSYLRKNFMTCTRPMAVFIEECFSNDENRDLPKALLESILSGMNYLCTSDGEHVFEIANTCAHQLNFSPVCGRRLSTKLEEYDRQLPSVAQICEFHESFKPCFVSHITSACGNKITKETWVELYDAMGSACSTLNTIEYRVDVF